MQRLVRMGLFTLVLVLVMTLSGVGCAKEEVAPPEEEVVPEEEEVPTPTPVEKPDEIVLYHIGDITGPYAPITGAAAIAAMEDVERYFNEHGGIDGVPVRLELTDTRNEREVAMSAYARYRDAKPKPLIMFIHQAADSEMLKTRLVEDETVGIHFSGTPLMLWPPAWSFQSMAAYTDLFGLFIDWLSEEWAKTGETRPCRLALFSPDQSWARSIDTRECHDYIEAKGIEVVAVEWWDFRAVDVTTEMGRVKAKEPDWIWCQNIAKQPLITLTAAKTLGMLPEVKFGMANWAMDRGAIRVAGGLMDGVIGVDNYPQSTDDSPGVKLMWEEFNKAGRDPNLEMTKAYICFWVAQALAAKAIEAAIAEVGWDKLDGRAVYNIMDSMEEVDVMGFQPFGYLHGKRSNAYARVVEVRGDDVYALTDWTVCPDMRPYAYRTVEWGWEE